MTTAMLGLCVLLSTGVLQWKECLAYPAAWDTVGVVGMAVCMRSVACGGVGVRRWGLRLPVHGKPHRWRGHACMGRSPPAVTACVAALQPGMWCAWAGRALVCGCPCTAELLPAAAVWMARTTAAVPLCRHSSPLN